jgi:hypothetical protein
MDAEASDYGDRPVAVTQSWPSHASPSLRTLSLARPADGRITPVAHGFYDCVIRADNARLWQANTQRFETSLDPDDPRSVLETLLETIARKGGNKEDASGGQCWPTSSRSLAATGHNRP